MKIFQDCILPLYLFSQLSTALVNIDLKAQPHALKIFENINEFDKRDLPAEIEVSDSNTVPIEDQGNYKASIYSNDYVSKDDVKATATTVKLAETTQQDGPKKDLKSGSIIKPATEDVEQTAQEGEKSKNPFLLSISMIIVSEIGDKTFLISALMAMRHPRLLVFSASFFSLAVMTILSGIVGHALPSLISQRLTQFLAAGLFLVFGFKLAKEGLVMSKELGVEEELAEVEEELEISDFNSDLNNVEGQNSRRSSVPKVENSVFKKLVYRFQNFASLILNPTWIQIFIMIFLGEWGDRSQIATIAMAASSDYWLVILGAVIGHGLCTLAAVIGGKMLASRISMRNVTLGGACAFFVFSVLYFYDAYTSSATAASSSGESAAV